MITSEVSFKLILKTSLISMIYGKTLKLIMSSSCCLVEAYLM